MATHDYNIANADGASVRQDINNALAAIVSNNSNATSPATTYAYQWWADTTTGQLKLRNSANSAWITIFELDGTMLMEDGTLAAPGLAFASDLDTGFSRSAANKINFSTGGAERLEIGSSEVVFNDPSNDVDFRVESNGNSHMLFVDAGNDRIGIGTSSPTAPLEVVGATNGDQLRITQSGQHYRIGREGSGGLLEFYGAQSGYNGFIFGGANGERLRIDSSGRLLVGTSSARSIADGTPNFQVEGTAGTASLGLVRNQNNSGGSGISFAKSRGTSVGANDAVQNNDTLGTINFAGADGTDINSNAASIKAEVDGTPGSNDMPGRLILATTADGASGPTERLRIDSSGRVGIGTSLPNNPLHVYHASQNVGILVESGDPNAYIAFKDDTTTSETAVYLGAEANDLTFFTSGTERMRIDSSGRLLAGLSSVSSGFNGKIVSRNDVNYASTEFEDDATLVLQNETNNNSAVLVFHSNDSSGNSGRSAIVGGTVNNGLGKLGFYGSCINKDSSTDADVTIDSTGNFGIGTTSPGSILEIHEPDNAAAIVRVYGARTSSGNNVFFSGFGSRGSTASPSSLQANDTIATFNCNAHDGSNYLSSGRVRFGVESISTGSVSSNIQFLTNNGTSEDERMRLDSSGRLLVGTTSTTQTSDIATFKQSGNSIISLQTSTNTNNTGAYFSATSSDGLQLAQLGVLRKNNNDMAGFLRLDEEEGTGQFFWVDNSAKFRISTNSSHVGTTNGTIIGTQTSDERLKNIGANVAYGLAEIKQLQPKQYNLIDDPTVNKIGFIAQEVESIIPEAVYDTNEELDGHQEGDRTKLAMEYVQLIPVLVNAIKELSAEVDTLKTKVAALEAG